MFHIIACYLGAATKHFYGASHTIWLAQKVATGSELSVAWPVGDRFRMLSEGPNRASSILAAIFQGQRYFFWDPSNPTSAEIHDVARSVTLQSCLAMVAKFKVD